LINQYIVSDIKRLSREICSKHNVSIKYMEVDKDHIHYMIETRPNINLSDFIRTMKSYTTYYIWQKYSAYLSNYFWKEHIL
jgi:putative transposase